ncbi:hypothetical protein GS399_04910 [Pedobacter sp. HMF7647]|uniref:Uncharacterized protein n=1 Tax=Hufsiella arboris TaxID=2695275 RepID=A0A7K1Y6V3_9SPHI|nr:hypothetical protein [Hufsiella arboris]MXV50303.1 hypothetical protein [Hufsiella arboris]
MNDHQHPRTCQHILGTSSTLLGFCLFVITSFHLLDKAKSTLIDDCASLIALILITSVFLSFFSIRATDSKKARRLEGIAEYIFVAALAGILIIILMIVTHFIN